MTTETDPRLLKRRLSPRVLRVRGVSGIGTRGGKLTVYLEKDSEAVRREVGAIVAAEAPDAPVAYEVTGTFRPQ